ncbi:hypothetical protein ABIB57_001311 [Devosia sp. UYZn731]|uniref:autotransporter outer membrane beta-barrel domain-containing protein n=1 Tax=Devosia sp. UYZn731 TaxID=3156345 RepID=UPI0033939C04
MYQRNRLPASARPTAIHCGILGLSTSAIALALAGALSSPVLAAEITVPGGATVGQQLLNPGDKLTIEAGAKVTDNVTPVYANNNPGNYTVVNQGTIEIANGNTISLDNLDLNNSGSILSVTGGGVYISGTGKIVNSGLITGHDAIMASSVYALNNVSGGTVTGDEYGVQAVNVDLIDNAGLINGDYIALNLNALGTLNNTATGVITNHTLGRAAISVGTNVGAINNAGAITGETFGIEVGGNIASLNNSGTLIVNDLANGAAVIAHSIGAVDNSGTMDGGYFGLYANTIGTLVNSGVINGNNSGIASSDTINSLTNSGHITANTYYAIHGNIIGSVVNTNEIRGGRFGIVADTSLASLTNSGTIIGDNDYGVVANEIGSIGNTGLIRGGQSGIKSYTTISSIANAASGRITGLHGIEADSNIGSITNAGTIAGEIGGIESTFGAITSLTNTGHITVSDQVNGTAVAATAIGYLNNSGDIGGGFTGIQAGALGLVVNSGRISAVNESLLATSIDSLDNSGIISGGDHAVLGFLHIGTIRNSGTIVGDATGVLSTGDLDSLENTGTIKATGEAMYVGGAIKSLVNSGTITAHDFAIEAKAFTSLTNSGLIGAADPTGIALRETGANSDTLLTLNAGSVLIGHVDIAAGNDILNVGNGLNLALTFDTSVPELIETNGAPYVIVGNTVYVADLAAFAAAGVATSDLANAVSGATGAALDEGFDEKGSSGQGHYWLQTIGGLGHDGATDMDLRYGGVVAGVDFGPDAVTRFGAFGGASRGAVGDTSAVSSFYAGVYGAAQLEDFSVKGTLTAGATNADTDRLVANNTVATGIETASSTQDAYFIAPSLLITRPWQTQDFSFETSLGLSYTGVFGADFTEDLATGLTVEGYDTHVFKAQGLLHLPFQTVLDGGTLTGDAHAGLEGRAVVAPEITGSLAGKAMTLASSNTQATAGAVAGGSLTYELVGGASIYGGIDAILRTDGSSVLSANAGLKGEF